jgi:hypothetical protein
LGRRSQTQRNHAGFLISAEQFFGRRPLALRSLKRLPKTPFDQPLANLLHRLHLAGKRFRNPLIGPVRSVRIRLEQDLSTLYLLTRSLQFLDHLLKFSPLLIREPNHILLSHGNPPWLPNKMTELAKPTNPTS